jgi:hypothetical protein
MRFFNEVAALPVLTALASAAGCSGGEGTKTEPTCLPEAASTACAAEYTPTFDNVFKYTLSMHCARPGCHVQPNPQGGMALDDIDLAYTNLVNAKSANGEMRVMPGDVKCGKVIVRLESVNEDWSMPPKPGHLPDPELCSIRQWIANGAMR